MSKQKLFSVTMKDCRLDVFRAGGKGGQNQNKVNSGVRITHEASGAVGEARDERDQHVNKKRAFERMAASTTFQNWLKYETARVTGAIARIEAKVEEELNQVRVESRNTKGNWVEGITDGSNTSDRPGTGTSS